MAAKTIREAIYKAITFGPLSSIEKRLQGEIRDFLAHSIAVYCHRHNSIKDHDILVKFVQDLIKDLPSNSGE